MKGKYRTKTIPKECIALHEEQPKTVIETKLNEKHTKTSHIHRRRIGQIEQD